MSQTNITRGYGLFENFLANQRMKKAINIIKKEQINGRILDIGCGKYPHTLLNSNCKEKYGIDQQVDNCIFESLNVNLLKQDFCINPNLPFSDNFFDVITMLAVIEHIEPEKIIPILKNCHNLLKKDGILIITTPANWSDFFLKLMQRIRLVSPEEILDHKNSFNLDKLTSLIQKANFQKENIHKGYFEFYLNLWLWVRKR